MEDTIPKETHLGIDFCLRERFAAHGIDRSQHSLAHLTNSIVHVLPIRGRMNFHFTGLVDYLMGWFSPFFGWLLLSVFELRKGFQT